MFDRVSDGKTIIFRYKPFWKVLYMRYIKKWLHIKWRGKSPSCWKPVTILEHGAFLLFLFPPALFLWGMFCWRDELASMIWAEEDSSCSFLGRCVRAVGSVIKKALTSIQAWRPGIPVTGHPMPSNGAWHPTLLTSSAPSKLDQSQAHWSFAQYLCLPSGSV